MAFHLTSMPIMALIVCTGGVKHWGYGPLMFWNIHDRMLCCFKACLTVTYRLQGARLWIDIRAKTDASTLCNITGHAYFNFTGAPTIADHQLQVAASEVLQVDETGIPSEAIMNVAGTQFDFQTPAALRHGDHPVMIDHNYCVSEGRTELRPIAWLSGGDTQMELASTEPGLQVYTGAGLGADLPSAPTGRAFHPYAGIALEPQIWPIAPITPNLRRPSCVRVTNTITKSNTVLRGMGCYKSARPAIPQAWG